MKIVQGKVKEAIQAQFKNRPHSREKKVSDVAIKVTKNGRK